MEVTPPKYEPSVDERPRTRRISFNHVIDAFLKSVERFPVTLCYLLAFIVWGVTDSWCYDLFYHAPQTIQNLQPALWFLTVNGMLLSLAVNLWCEQICRQRFCNKIQLAANLLLLADFVNMILNFNSFSDSVWVGRMAVETALVVAVIFVPALKATSQRHRLMFSFMQLGNMIVAGAIAAIMTIAVSIIYGTVTLLFGDIRSEIFISCLIIFSAGLGILIFLGSIPTYWQTAALAADYQPEKFQVAIVRYILLPLTAIYTLILYIYGLKIIVTGVMPKGEICFMVAALTAAVYLLLFLLKALDGSQNAEDRLTRLSLKFFPLAMLPLLVMMSVAIGERIEQYGMTVARLYVLTFNIWAYITAIYLFATRSRNTNAVAMSFAIIFLLTSIIPGVNYTSLVQHYMRNRVFSLLENAGVDKSQLPLSHKQFEEIHDKMDAEDWRDITSKLRYLDDRDDHSLVSDIADFKIQTGYYEYDHLFDDLTGTDEVVVEEVELLPELHFSDDNRMVVMPEGYKNVRYYSTAKYGMVVDGDHILTFPVTSDIRIRLDMDSIRSLDQKVNHKPLVRSIEGIPTDSSVFVISKIDYFISDENYNENKKVNNITVNGYLFTK